MKTTKTAQCLFLCGMIGCVALINESANAGSVTRRGPDVLHYVIRNRMGPTEVGPRTDGWFQMQFTERGERITQRFRLNVSGLETNTDVGITAAIGDDVANVHTVASAPTDRKGRLRVSYVSRTPVPARGEPVPEMLSPLTDVGAFCVEDSSGQLVGSGGVFDALKFQYVVKRNLTPENPGGSAAGSMNLVANQNRASFSLVAGGLEPGTEYDLVLNSTVVATATANETGTLRLRGWPAEAPPVVQLRSLLLVDSGGNTVLSTTLPR